MADIEFDFDNQTITSELSVASLITWIGALHSELTNEGHLPHGVSDQTHNELMVFAHMTDSLSINH